ncbi:MAG: hypothetical protein ABRQ30_04305, partial [Smithellaceae bacterium]
IAAINQGDIAGARDRAIRGALQRAIQEAASALISIPVNDKKFPAVKKALLDRQNGFIKNYKITAEGQQDKNYLVDVNVSVAFQDLKNFLAEMGYYKTFNDEEADITVFLEAKGLKNYSDFLYLKEFLKKQAKMVKNIRSQSFKWQQACLELEISGTTQALAVELGKTGRYLVDTEQTRKNQIVVNLLQEEGEE